jgi:hypothetical protein
MQSTDQLSAPAVLNAIVNGYSAEVPSPFSHEVMPGGVFKALCCGGVTRRNRRRTTLLQVLALSRTSDAPLPARTGLCWHR